VVFFEAGWGGSRSVLSFLFWVALGSLWAGCLVFVLFVVVSRLLGICVSALGVITSVCGLFFLGGEWDC